MKIFLIFFVLFLYQNGRFVHGNEFVTLWAPKAIYANHNYSAIVLPTKLQGKTEVALQFRNNNLTKKLNSGHAVRIDFPKIRYGNRKEVNLTMTLHVDEPIDRHKTVRICSTKSLKIKIDRQMHHTFIQTDKPIYKPGDEVKFRVLVVDRDMKPWHMNNIDVNIIDPLNGLIAHFDDLKSGNIGVFEDKFNIASQTVLGDWKIEVIVDRKNTTMMSKTFSIQKYTYPLFDVHVSVSHQHVLSSTNCTITFRAEYPFGELVTGNAELKIRGVKNQKSYYKGNFDIIHEIKTVPYLLITDRNIAKEEMEMEAIVTFTEPESGLSYSKSAKFFFHTDSRHKMIAKHPKKFLPGHPFSVKVNVNNWKGEQILNHTEKVELTATLGFGYEFYNSTNFLLNLRKGNAVHEIMIPKNATELKITIAFLDCEQYERTIEMGSTEIGINELFVYHEPEYPKLNQIVDVYIKSDRILDNVIAIVMTRYGPVKGGKIDCKNGLFCKFGITVNEKMMPQSTIIIYEVRDHVNIFQGKTEIKTENLGANYLNLKLSSDQPKPRDQLQMSFSTKEKSKIHLLAFDKRLKSLQEGNDITKEEVIKTFLDYDGENYILVDDMTTWHECTQEELLRVDKGRKAMEEIENKKNLVSAGFYSNTLKGSRYDDDDDDDEDLFDLRMGFEDDEEDSDYDQDPTEEPNIEDEEIRKNFPETWIFETIEVGVSSEAVRNFTVPDSITSWEISAFSINKDDGLAVMNTHELKVKNEFFIKVNLPYSIRFKEVLRLDILIYNYIESYEQLEVTVDLKQNENFQIVKYASDDQQCLPINDKNSSRTAKVPPMGVKKVFFYIKASPADAKDFEAKMSIINLLVTAKAKSEDSQQTYKDALQQELRVEPIGLRIYDISTNKFYLDGKSTNPRIYEYFGHSEYARYSSIISGNYLSDLVNLESNVEIFSSTLDKKALILKEAYEVYRFYLSKGQKVSNSLVNLQYQNIMSILSNKWVKPSVQFRIMYVDILAALMKAQVIVTDRAKIQEHLNVIESELLENIGQRSLTSDPWFENKTDSDYFKVAFALIPFIKHNNLVSSGSDPTWQHHSGYRQRFRYNYKSYNNTIEKGMNYLKNYKITSEKDTIGLSIGAYVHALNGKKYETQKLLAKVEELSVNQQFNQKCFKLKASDDDCDKLHTAYAALAYLKLNKASEVKPIFHWLLESNPLNKFTYEHAVAMEAISEAAIQLKTTSTLLKVRLENKIGYETVVDIQNDKFVEPKYIEFPEYTHNVSSKVSGHGFCSISIISERIQAVPQRNKKFIISIEIDKASRHKNERTVKVCATYSPRESNFQTLNDVFYEVELPSGYIYDGYSKESDGSQNIMEVQERRKGTIVSVYFYNFEKSKQYCVTIKALKIFNVFESKEAAVKVYDFSDKENNDVSFYTFSNQKCQT